MLTKQTTQQLRGLYALSKQTQWEEVSKIFDNELVATYKQLTDSRDDAVIRQMQGRAQFITQFQAMVRNAGQNLEKLGETTL